MSVYFTYSGGKLTFTDDSGKPYVVKQGDKNFALVAQALNEKKSLQEILALFNHGVDMNKLQNDSGGRVTYENGEVLLDGKVLHNSLAQRVKDFASWGIPFEYLLKFIAKIEQNPSFNSRNQLYGFLEHSDIVIHEDGDFVAYKAVRNDYLDKYTATILNNVGARVKMDRSQIDDNPRSHCSCGLHVGSIKYAGTGGFYHNGGDRTMLVKVNPKDVVSVPNDHSCKKCRVCEYEVIGEVSEPLTCPLYTAEGNQYEPEFTDSVTFDGFDYDYDDYEASDIYDYDDEEDEYDSWIDDLNLPEEIEL